MKWVLLISIVLIILVFAILRKKVVSRPQPSAPMLDSRRPIPFEEFYDHYYAESGLSDTTVFKLIDFISITSGVDYKLILPDDRIDDFPKGSLRKPILEFAEIMVKAVRTTEPPKSGVWFDPQIETVDDFIRKLGPLAARVEEQQRQLHHS